MTLIISLISLFLALFGAVSVQADIHATGAVYKTAAQSLDKISDKQLAQAITKLEAEPSLVVWIKFLEIDHHIINKRYAEALNSAQALNSTSLSPLQLLYKKKVFLELALHRATKQTLSKNDFQHGISTLKAATSLKAEIQYLEALNDLNNHNFKRGISKLQSIKLNLPSSVTASKSFALIDYTFKKNPSLLKTLKTRDFIINELRGLLFNNRANEAEKLLSMEIKNKTISDYKDKEIFLLKNSILKATNKSPQLKSYLETLATSNSPLKYSALSELALQAWNKNDTADLEVRMRQLGKSPFTSYLEARVAEESGDLNSAKTKYSWLYKIGGHRYLQQTGFRLAWLQINAKEFTHAAQTLQRLKKINNNDSYFDTEAITYWLDKTRKLKPAANTPYFWDVRHYYFWLFRGANVNTPDSIIFQNQSSKISSCGLSPLPFSIPNQSQISRLAQLGLLSLFEDEINLALPARESTRQHVYSRAMFALQLGGATTAIKEIRSSPKIYAAMERECLFEILPILYPRQHLDIFEREARRNGVDKYLLMAITRTESTFDPLARSRVGAMGLMQLMPKTAEMEGFAGFEQETPELLFSPAENIKLGANHLRRLFDKYGNNWHLIIAGYNAGSQAVDRWLKRYPNTTEELWVEMINFKETRHYVKKVLSAYWSYRMLESAEKNQLAQN
jgi:hypothetical protein